MMRFASITNRGGRLVNEDALAVYENGANLFCVLCDGLGGHGAGDVAATLAVETILSVYKEKNVVFQQRLAAGMVMAQETLLQKQIQLDKAKAMKTTVVMLQIVNDKAQWAHIGDSRIYHFQNNKIRKRSIDHSVPQMLALQGEIAESEIRHHEDRNRLTRVLGVEWETPQYVISQDVRVFDSTAFLLCSDGFWEHIDEQDMEVTLRQSSTPLRWLKAMEKIVLKNATKNEMDNYSAITVFAKYGAMT